MSKSLIRAIPRRVLILLGIATSLSTLFLIYKWIKRIFLRKHEPINQTAVKKEQSKPNSRVVIMSEFAGSYIGKELTPRTSRGFVVEVDSINADALKVVASEKQSFIITKDGDVYGCGDNTEGVFYETKKKQVYKPTKLHFVSNVIDLDARHNRVVVLTSSGKVLQWGEGHSITQVPITKNIIKVFCTDKMYALSDDGELFEWNHLTKPVVDSCLTNVASCSFSDTHKVILTKSGSVYTYESFTKLSSPVLAPLDKGVIQVAAGNGYYLALMNSGEIYAWWTTAECVWQVKIRELSQII
ncbi:E3 ubiquitin-protein ligase HERC [Acrasis kona]|uniref:E3 ubiquitin-protein ligase HERC n=1 Tax=Acrasis kona TaxID=1008807 RepID=A0AAW2YQ63_9EUKA